MILAKFEDFFKPVLDACIRCAVPLFKMKWLCPFNLDLASWCLESAFFDFYCYLCKDCNEIEYSLVGQGNQSAFNVWCLLLRQLFTNGQRPSMTEVKTLSQDKSSVRSIDNCLDGHRGDFVAMMGVLEGFDELRIQSVVMERTLPLRLQHKLVSPFRVATLRSFSNECELKRLLVDLQRLLVHSIQAGFYEDPIEVVTID